MGTQQAEAHRRDTIIDKNKSFAAKTLMKYILRWDF